MSTDYPSPPEWVADIQGTHWTRCARDGDSLPNQEIHRVFTRYDDAEFYLVMCSRGGYCSGGPYSGHDELEDAMEWADMLWPDTVRLTRMRDHQLARSKR